MKILFFGSGGSTSCHIGALRSHVSNLEIITVTDNQKLSGSFHDSKIFPRKDISSLCLSPDLVVICSRNCDHFNDFMLAHDFQCPVVIEKPLSSNLSYSRSICSISAARVFPTLCFYQRRHHPAVNRLKSLIHNGHLGKIHHVSLDVCRFKQPARGWKSSHSDAGGGMLLQVAIHYLDLIYYLFNKPSFDIHSSVKPQSGAPERYLSAHLSLNTFLPFQLLVSTLTPSNRLKNKLSIFTDTALVELTDDSLQVTSSSHPALNDLSISFTTSLTDYALFWQDFLSVEDLSTRFCLPADSLSTECLISNLYSSSRSDPLGQTDF